MTRITPRIKFTLLLSSMLLTSCTGMTVGGRVDKAISIADASSLQKQTYKAGRFVLSSWSKITAPQSHVATVYIEGDGFAWVSRSEPSGNPTPKNPVALQMAAIDPAPNVIYLARPCQFTPLQTAGNDCREEDWTAGRFAPDILQSFHEALSQIAATGITSFHVVGYSGGANIAGLLAAQRRDIVTLRSVAGNVDNDAFTALHNVSPMPKSLNMASNALAISKVPQIHFVGMNDTVIPPAIAEGFRAKAENSACIQIEHISGVAHADGWLERWPELVKETPICR